MPEERATRASQGRVPPGHAWLEEVFRAYYAELCTFVCRYVHSDDAAEDVMQDLFVSIWRNPERWTGMGDALRPLLFVAARNRALDYLKHQRVRARHAQRVLVEDESHAPPSADEAVLYREIKDDIDRAIDSLPARAREIFRLSRDEGLTYREIAERLGLSIKTVENQMGRSLKKLRTRLASYV